MERSIALPLRIATLLLALLSWDQVSAQSQHQHQHAGRAMPSSSEDAPAAAGQSAFAAIQEVVRLLAADPKTDWSKVNIDALRNHLVDMHEVTLNTLVSTEAIERGARYQVTGTGRTVGAIQRMVTAHSRQMSEREGWNAVAEEIPNGVSLTITGSGSVTAEKIRGLGFAGFMALGGHHQPHHLQMATGQFGHDQH